jgi:hypothetical protein
MKAIAGLVLAMTAVVAIATVLTISTTHYDMPQSGHSGADCNATFGAEWCNKGSPDFPFREYDTVRTVAEPSTFCTRLFAEDMLVMERTRFPAIYGNDVAIPLPHSLDAKRHEAGCD